MSAITVLIVCLVAPLAWYWVSRTFMLMFFSPERMEAQIEADRKRLAQWWPKLAAEADAIESSDPRSR